jgi:hypothetical protein
MKRFSFSVLAIGALFAVGFAVAFDAINLKRTPKVGDKVTFSLDGTLTISGMDVAIGGKGTETITGVGTDGTFTADSTQTEFTINGQSQSLPDTPTKQVEKLDGELVSAKGPGEADSARLNNLLTFFAPETPVNVGDTWSRDIKPTVEGSVPIHVEGKLVGLEKIGSWDTAKIDETVKETGADGASAHSTIWVNTIDGSGVKQVADVANIAFGPTTVSTGKLTMTRVAN